VRAGFVHKNQTRRGDGGNRFEEAFAPGRNAWGVAFLGNEGLFFRVKPSRATARTIVERDTSASSSRLYAAAISSMLQSGFASSSRRTCVNFPSGIFGR